MEIKPIAYINTDFKEKFGIPRQSGRVGAEGEIVFLKEYQNPDALRGIESFSHLWLLFDFSQNHREGFSPTVRPPRLGGNTHIGVFASRAPFRPNNIGLSCVELIEVKKSENDGLILRVKGVDLLDKTPIYDIKPYIPYCDCIENARGSYAENFKDYTLKVQDNENKLLIIPENKRKIAINCLCEDIRPSYQEDSKRIYKWLFSDYEISFKVENDVVIVTECVNIKNSEY